MALEIDTTRALRTPGQLADLARAIHGARPEDETHWLEWKCEADLKGKEWLAQTARFILATANRPQRVADLAVDGCAYMVLGAEPGRFQGTVLPDSAALGDGLRRYLGDDGPVYSAITVTVDGISIVVVSVEPTRPSDRPYLARGTYSTDKDKVVVQDGRTYIRRPGQTEEASSTEVQEMLAERRRFDEAGPGWELRVNAAIDPEFVCVDWEGSSLEGWIVRERKGLTGHLLPEGSAGWPLTLSAENRSREQFRYEVEDYLGKAREQMGTSLLCHLSSAARSTLDLDALNDGEDTLCALVVEVDLPPGADAVGSWRDVPYSDRWLSPPRPYGSIPELRIPMPPTFDRSVFSGVRSEVVGDHIRVILSEREVRPLNHARLHPMTILFPARYRGHDLTLAWRAHSSDRKGVATGELTIKIPDRALTIYDTLHLKPAD